MKGLKNKVAIVTGAGQGLGRSTALRLAEEGCHVLVNDIDEARAEACVKTIKETGRKACVFSGDIGDHETAAAMVATALAQLGDLHILVNNAGILRDALLTKLSEKDFDEVIRVNLKGAFNCGQAAAAAIIQQEHGGTIINISSLAYRGNIGQTSYSAAKAGMLGLTWTWARELAKHEIRVNAIAPGLMDTTMIQDIPAPVVEKLLQSIPLQRLGRPDELASTVAFLASDEASYINGQVLHLDGGASTGL